MKILIITFLIVFIVYFRKVKIKWKTFFHKGFYKSAKPYGVYCYCGKQGKGKTYSVVEFLLNNSDYKIYANISSIEGIDYTYFSGFDELLKLRDEHDCIIVFDEIFTALTKTSKMNTEILDFLSQMRKRRIIFITTAQEWLEINITLRRYCRYQIDCNMFSIFGYPILIKHLKDAEQMTWSQNDNEYIAPLIETTISHGMKSVINAYDTFEQIKTENVSAVRDKSLTNAEQKANKKAIADTTTISNGMVNGQWTQILHKNNVNSNELDTTLHINNNTSNNIVSSSSIDNDFWGDLKINDFESDNLSNEK